MDEDFKKKLETLGHHDPETCDHIACMLDKDPDNDTYNMFIARCVACGHKQPVVLHMQKDKTVVIEERE